MRKIKRRATAAAALAAALTFGSAALPAAAAAAPTTPVQDDVYERAIAAESSTTSQAAPQALPAIAWGAVAVARGFTAARAPQQVAQVARAASFIHGLMGGAAPVRANLQNASLDVIFDH